LKIEHDCPHCKKGISLDTEKMEIIELTKEVKGSINKEQPQVLEQLEKPKPEIKIETVIEDFKPGYECPDGNCEVGVHKNKNYSKRVKGKCSHCDQFTKHDKGKCPWCEQDEIEPIEQEELEEMGIKMPQIDEHEGHDHE